MRSEAPETEQGVEEIVEQEYQGGEEDDEEYEVERLLDHRASVKRENTIEYLIKWKNYDETWNTWENEQNVFSDELIEDYWSHQSTTRDAVLQKSKSKKHGKSKAEPAEDTKQKKLKSNETLAEDGKEQASIRCADDQILRIATTENPPAGMTWDKDAVAVVHVYANDNNVLYGEVKWSNEMTTFCPTLRLREICPIL
ncbi:hypothetical protein DFQ30_004025, partial [Apophysomyces sp. BC1015]